jgi:hypothetical protein
VDAPDIVWVFTPIEEMNLEQGDTILSYARFSEGWADLWSDGCWLKRYAPTLSLSRWRRLRRFKLRGESHQDGRQTWWFCIQFPNRKTGWTLSQSLGLAAEG